MAAVRGRSRKKHKAPEPETRMITATRKTRAMACVMGGMDLVRPLGMAGIRCAVVAEAGSAPLYSRFVDVAMLHAEFWSDAPALLETLLQFATTQSEQPTLFYEQDSQLLFVSRHRDRLATAFRFVIPDPTLVEDLVDKSRFGTLAERLGLPVPASRRISPRDKSEVTDLDIPFPVIVKPLTRRETWVSLVGSAKALQVDNDDAMRVLWPRLAESGMDFLVQAMIPGAETRIESYHVYADAGGGIAAEFTGRKIRTYPASYGHSTALTITDAPDVIAIGRELVERLGLRGVAKFDFKRDPDGRLHLLEVNPRFNLWHHLGAVAGVNIPAIVYADLIGSPRPVAGRARAGARWCMLPKDLRAARASGIPLHSHLAWAWGCEAKSSFAWDDPMPALRRLFRFFARARRAAPVSPAPLQDRATRT